MALHSTHGFAVMDDGEINIRTVCDTERGAIVNWLVVERGLLVLEANSDYDIQRMWTSQRPDNDRIKVVPVRVEHVSK